MLRKIKENLASKFTSGLTKGTDMNRENQSLGLQSRSSSRKMQIAVSISTLLMTGIGFLVLSSGPKQNVAYADTTAYATSSPAPTQTPTVTATATPTPSPSASASPSPSPSPSPDPCAQSKAASCTYATDNMACPRTGPCIYVPCTCNKGVYTASPCPPSVNPGGCTYTGPVESNCQ